MWWLSGVALAQSVDAARIGPLALGPGWEVAATASGWTVSSAALEALGVTVSVRATPSAEPTCRPSPLRSGPPERTSTVTVHGLVWSTEEGWLGCRNARPPTVHACAVVAGQHVQLEFAPRGCRGGPGAGAFESLLAGILPGAR